MIFLTQKQKAQLRNEKLLNELNELNETFSKKLNRKNERLSVLKVYLLSVINIKVTRQT
jgi:hypothetical protein